LLFYLPFCCSYNCPRDLADIGEYKSVCLNPKDIPPDDLGDVILGRIWLKRRGWLSGMNGGKEIPIRVNAIDTHKRRVAVLMGLEG
jgi:hypothetical protein